MRSATRRRWVVTVAAILALSGVAATPANAHTMDGSFGRNGELFGYCGFTSGGWVMAIQAILKTHHINIGNFGPWGNGIDGYWGSASDSGVKQWQGMHGLSQDGCVGQQTWDNSMVRLTTSTPPSSPAHRVMIANNSQETLWTVSNHVAPSHSNYGEALFGLPAGSSSVWVEIRYAGSATGGSRSTWDCRVVNHSFTTVTNC